MSRRQDEDRAILHGLTWGCSVRSVKITRWLIVAPSVLVVVALIIRLLLASNDPPIPAGVPNSVEFSRELPLHLPTLLETIYMAFDEVGEVAVYDRIAKAAADQALEELYLETVASSDRAGLEAKQSIHDIEVVSLTAQVKGQTVLARAEWRVLGTVGHAEHMHMRGNGYIADLVLAPRNDGWRITEFHLVDIDRSDVGKIYQHDSGQGDNASEDGSKR